MMLRPTSEVGSLGGAFAGLSCTCAHLCSPDLMKGIEGNEIIALFKSCPNSHQPGRVGHNSDSGIAAG